MKILLDQGVPVPLRTYLADHRVSTAFELDWATLKNGELLDAAERDGIEVLLTTDQNLEHQQNLTGRTIAILVLGTTAWPKIKNDIPAVVTAISMISAGEVQRVDFPA